MQKSCSILKIEQLFYVEVYEKIKYICSKKHKNDNS